MDARETTARVWALLGGDPALLEAVGYHGPGGLLAARLPVMGLARASVAVCALAAAELAARRSATATRLPRVHVDDAAVATAFVSERHLRMAGRAASGFAPLSRFWPTRTGWVRVHANYPHHRARLLAALGVEDRGAGTDEALAARVAGALAERAADEVEDTVSAAGGLAVAVRQPERWAAHPQGRAIHGRPLLTLDRGGDAPPRRLGHAAPDRPAAGVRVLDLTRVIAGPVATRTLAFLGADVLRVDSPRLPERQAAHDDTGFGKRSATLDLGAAADRATFEGLLDAADVVVTGYRPGSLDRFGLAPDALAERRPGLVVARLSAWGDEGPWARRRGFDSLVQAATGIAVLHQDDDGTPGALPAQALDHATGYLLAAAVLRALTGQLDRGGTRIARLALAQTAHWLMRHVPAGPDVADRPGADDPAPWLTETSSALGLIRHARSPVRFDGGPDAWPRPPGRLGADPPRWQPAP